ncbi:MULTISPECIES: ROK family transcriptional regulator [Streptomyces]|uniref:ROK family transcriptional regulator n=2 Tax=Streptomyces TaxID=1883 RepID=A0A420UYX4_9ACTN|nr:MULTISPECIES: ROK family transcriptional regulator [Streptomyces]KNE82092.1 transcriptional regulator [Streptomyces fradiae]OFA49523.1 transcriptional regulator [Streptomyces fradiae]PQM21740.1 ROK family transcriptional regulator [Streptomyces xinghaiensis]RKM93173.1 ROK family transcriptional regulator [Streptomyces xinghaiensis]RNC71229.1 ROK family transcriptional regulator [Streptomyces xinghaiensis]
MRRTSRDIRTANRYGVLRQIIAHSPVSRQELAAATGLSLATVANLVGELLALGLLTEVGFEESAGGRPRGLVAVNASGGTLVGVDVAETYVHVELFDLALNVLARADEELRPGESGPDQVIGHIAAAVESVTGRAGSGAGDGDRDGRILGIGVSVPGQVDREGGVSVYAPNWDWHDVPLLSLLAGHLPHPLHLDNPLRACTVAELWFGAARDRGDAVVVNLGTGVGAGLALGGSLHRGVTNSAGEWGHTTLVLDGHPCHCGNRGCVETYVGAPGIMRRLRELDPGSPLLRPGDQTATVAALARAAAEGDPVAVAAVRETARFLGAGIADLVNLLNPEVIVLSSWVASLLGEPLLTGVREVVARHALARPLAGTEIVLSPIPTNPVSLGAATFALEGFLASVGRGTPGPGAPALLPGPAGGTDAAAG